MNKDYNDLFAQFFDMPLNGYYSTVKYDNYEINQTKDGVYILIDVPGFNKSNLSVEFDDGVLTVTGSRKYKVNGEEKNRDISKKFRIYRKDIKSIELIEATVEDGVLTIYIPSYIPSHSKEKIKLL